MRRLRDPERGCPWDLKQSHESLAQYMLEEAYEVVEVIEDSDGLQTSSDKDHLCEELGDVLLQIVFHAQIASENG
ncbi:MAG TPA: nucleoside triphosphate pyrophosphohydrolase, partial [Rhodospirillaceae bacterium]|nr:nucleoside triphosphate pyrophosphohydrolase [Rhodospirillaceae bacterium]